MVMAKFNFLNHDESFSYISQLHGNSQKKTRKMKVLCLGSDEKKTSKRDLKNIEARFAKGSRKWIVWK